MKSIEQRFSTKAEAIRYAREIIEETLQKSFGYDIGPPISFLKRRLSIHSQKVSPLVNHESLRSKCFAFSEELKHLLGARGIHAEIVRRAGASVEHYYLIAYFDNYEVFIDPTIGQFLKGHNHVFVGSREDLKAIVIGGAYQIINTSSPHNSQQVFEKIWGQIAVPNAKRFSIEQQTIFDQIDSGKPLIIQAQMRVKFERALMETNHVIYMDLREAITPSDTIYVTSMRALDEVERGLKTLSRAQDFEDLQKIPGSTYIFLLPTDRFDKKSDPAYGFLVEMLAPDGSIQRNDLHTVFVYEGKQPSYLAELRSAATHKLNF